MLKGSAIEARINAEDPAAGYRPALGAILGCYAACPGGRAASGWTPAFAPAAW